MVEEAAGSEIPHTQVGKRTLPVMLGLGFGRVEITVLPAVAYVAGGFWCVPALQWSSG